MSDPTDPTDPANYTGYADPADPQILAIYEQLQADKAAGRL